MIKILAAMLLIVVLSGCSISGKSWGSAYAADAFEVTTPQLESGETSAKLTAGGGAGVLLFQKAYTDSDNFPTMVGFSRRKSLWGLFSGADTGNICFMYIAGSKETPQETLKIIEQVKSLVIAASAASESKRQDE